MNIPINIKLPKNWTGNFVKNEWNSINFIVGANGTGKSLFSNELQQQLQQNNFKVRLLSAERMSGFEKHDYSYFSNSDFRLGLNLSYTENLKQYGQRFGLSADAFVILKERLDIRIKIEAILSDLFKKKINLVEEGGYLKPKMQDFNGGEEYGLKENECHGMKEIISLLTFLYDDEFNCIILDEPELHLHPQFQSFFLNEIRKLAGNPKEEDGKKIFFIITHSPYFLDIHSIEDLENVLVCHYNTMPTYIEDGNLNDQDKYILKKFIPRFNTHHKQFFFSPNPVFVEGYTDQQIISLLFEKLGLDISAAGSSIIDVGGKDELAVFYKLCNYLKIDCRIFADYDAFFRGRLREFICLDQKIKDVFSKGGFGEDISKCIGDVERLLLKIGDELVKNTSTETNICNITSKLNDLYDDKGNNLEKIKDIVLLSLYRFKEKLENILPDLKSDIESVLNKHAHYIECIKSGNIFIIPNGELEHFFKYSEIDYLNITRKDELFNKERDNLLDNTREVINKKYKDIIPLLKELIPYIEIDLHKHVQFTIMEWIQKVQGAIVRKEVTDIDSLRSNNRVEYNKYKQILECKDDGLKIEENGKFTCTIFLKKSVLNIEKPITFYDTTIAREFEIKY